MALSLPGERSVSAATLANPVAALAQWIRKAQAARTRRMTLASLRELDDARLYDLGISRADILLALSRKDSLGLNAARARNARR